MCYMALLFNAFTVGSATAYKSWELGEGKITQEERQAAKA